MKDVDPSNTTLTDIRTQVAQQLGWPAHDLEPHKAILKKCVMECATEAAAEAAIKNQVDAADVFMKDAILEASRRPGSTVLASLPAAPGSCVSEFGSGVKEVQELHIVHSVSQAIAVLLHGSASTKKKAPRASSPRA